MNKSLAPLKGTVLSAVALSTLLMLAGSTPLAAQTTTLTITLGSQETLYLDANACSSAGPRAAWLSFIIKNTGANTATNINAVFAGFTGVTGALVQPSYFSAPADLTRNYGSLAPGAQVPAYFYVDYSAVCLHSLGGGSPYTGYTANYSLTVTAANATTVVRNSSVISGDLLTAQAAGVASTSNIDAGYFVGQVLNQTVTYSFGNNTNLFFQPAGDVGFDATCIRLVGSEITGGSGNIPVGVIGQKDQLWFPTASTTASNNTLDLRYTWKILCTNQSQTMHPFAAAFSGQKFKYAGYAFSTVLPASLSSLTVTKAVSPTSDTVNTNTPTWTVTFTNSGSAPVYLSRITDVLPACMTINQPFATGSDVTFANSLSAPVGGDGGTVSWIGYDLGNSTSSTYLVPANSSLLLKYTTNVSACTIPSTSTNSVTGLLGSTTIGPATAPYILGGVPAISLSKSANPTTYTAAGQSITYTYTITNTGTATLLGPYSVTDNKIGTLTNCATGTLAPSATTTCTGNYSITAGDITAGSVTNLATATTTYNASPVNSNQATATITANVADLVVTKGDLSSTYTPGTDVTYTIGVTNNGPVANTGFTLTDSLPSGTSFVSASAGCVQAAGIVTCTSGGLAVSGSVNWTITIHVDASRTGNLVNTAAIATNNTVDPNTANNTATDTDTQASSADLVVTKTDGVGTYTAGNNVSYTITVTNNGPSDNAGFTLTDGVPAGASFVSASAGCAEAAGLVTCTSSGLTVGSSVNWTVTVHVDSSKTGSLVNTASIATNTTPDPNGANNTSTDTDTAVPSADLVVIKTDGVGTYTAGSNVSYTVTVTNNGPSDNAGFTLSDILPAGTSFVSASAGCIEAAGTVTCTSTGLAASASVNWTITIHVDSSKTGSLVNTAGIATNSTPDPNGANNSSTDTDTPSPSADLAVAKTDGSGTYAAGSNVSYTITVTNNGPSDNAGFTLTDAVPAGASFVSASAGCLEAAGIVTCTSAGLTASASVNWTITIHVDSSKTGNLVNTASIATNSTPDPNGANDSASDTDTPAPSADLAVTKTDGSATYTAGTNVTYTITVTNNGASDNAGFTLTDAVPAGTSFVSASAGCVEAAGIVTCTSTGLTASSSVNWTITIHVNASKTGNLVNTASIATNSTNDPNGANNSDTDTDTPSPSADLAVAKTDGSGTYTPGNNVSYTITVTNSGPSDNAGFTLTDAVPAGTSFVSASAGCAEAAGTVTCTSTGLATGASVNWTVTVHVNSAKTGTLVNTASIATNTTNDPVPGNNSATDTDTQASIVDLSVTKTDGVTVYTPGSNVVYTIVVANAGPSNAIGATVVDTLPSSIGATIWTASATGGATGFTANGSGAINDTVNVPAGATITYLVTVAVPLNRTGPLTNSVTVNAPGGTTDSNPANNSATDTDNSANLADLSLTKDDGLVLYTPGTDVTYTITVTNQGPSPNTGFTVTDVLPSGTTFVSAPGCSFAANTVTCTSAGLPLSGAAVWTVTVHTDANRTGCLTNTASIATNTTADPNLTNNSSTDSDYPQPTTAFSTGLGLALGYPTATGNNTLATATTYTAATKLFKVDTTPATIRFAAADTFHSVTGSPTLALRASVGNNGVLLGGFTGNDLTLTGTVTDQFAVTHTGTLLTGEIVAFGYRDVGTTDRFELRFVVTGGLLASQFAGKDIGVVITAENSTFANSFAGNFSSTGKFSMGSLTKVCPAN